MLLSCATLTFQGPSADPTVKRYTGMNQVYNVAQPGKSTETIAFLGKLDSVDACEKACLANAARCWSYTYHGASMGTFAGQCFGIIAPRWSPTPDVADVVSAKVSWPYAAARLKPSSSRRA